MNVSESSVERSSFKNIEAVNLLIAAAKSHWNYPQAYLKLALEHLKIDRKYLEENICFDIFRDGEVVGFASVTEKNGDKYLDHLWIHPRFHRLGLGRLACGRVFEIARNQGWRCLFVLPDPPAARFYEKMGFVDTSIQVPSKIKDGPNFSLMKIDLCDAQVNQQAQASNNLYSPSHYRENRTELIHELIRKFPFATLLTIHGEKISHLPLILEQCETAGYQLLGHMAKANPHWQELAKKPFCKAIFQGSHGYVSPAWYEPKRDNVPTWNYMVVHAKGRFEKLTSSKAHDAMSHMVTRFESTYGTGWQLTNGAQAIDALMREIIVFKIYDLELDAKFKLSQNQSQTNRNNVIRELKKLGDQNLDFLADQMELTTK